MQRHPAERLLVKLARGIGLRVLRFEWEGSRLLCLIEFPGGHRRFIWLVNDPTERAFRSGRVFSVGDRRPEGSDEGAGEADPRHVEALMTRVLQAFERVGQEFRWEAPVRWQSESVPDMLYGNEVVELRITERCNERCLFCNTAGPAQNIVPNLPDALEVMRKAKEAGATRVAVTGGEPLLVPWLFSLLRSACNDPFEYVTVQTNAVLLARDIVIHRLAELGPKLHLQISLHAATSELSGRLTLAPKLWEPKISGIKKALERGIRTNFNIVACKQNLHELESFVHFIHSLPGFEGMLTFSLVAPVAAAWENRVETVPSYTDAGPPLLAAMRLARELGMNVQLPESCSIPVCLVPEFSEFIDHLADTEDMPLWPDRVKFPGCKRCEFNGKCPGIYESYLAHFGDEEFDSLK